MKEECPSAFIDDRSYSCVVDESPGAGIFFLISTIYNVSLVLDVSNACVVFVVRQTPY